MHYDTEIRTVGDLRDWQMVLLDTRCNRCLFCVPGDDFSLAGDHLCLCHGRGVTILDRDSDINGSLQSD